MENIKVVAITGTPGTGKTTLAKRIVEKLGMYYLDPNTIIREDPSLVIEHDDGRDTDIIDDERLIKSIVERIKEARETEGKEGLIIDSHLSHYIPKKNIDFCIVLSCDIKELRARLEKRGYNKMKIEENIETETFDEILEEARDEGHYVYNIDTSEKSSEDVLKEAVDIIKS